MKIITALCIASVISMAAQAHEVGDTTEPQVLDPEAWSRAWDEGQKKALEALKARHANLDELERLAVPIYGGASREQLLPHRFSDASKLQGMLRDPEWAIQWHKIAVGIAIIADKKAALDLIEFIKDSEAPKGYEQESNRARAIAIAALGYTLIDKDIPEVLEFLEKMVDDSFAESLDFKAGETTRSARLRAYAALYTAATDEAMDLLERTLNRKTAEKDRQTIQALSVGGYPSEDREDRISREVSLLERYIERSRRNRAGVAPEISSDEMP